MTDEYLKRYSRENMGPVVHALVRRTWRAYRATIGGKQMTSDDLTELSIGQLAFPEDDLRSFMTKVDELGGYESDANYKTVAEFLGLSVVEEEVVTPPLHNSPSDGPETSRTQNGSDDIITSGLVWSDEHTVVLDDQVFDLNDKVLREQIVTHIRVAKGGQTWAALLKLKELNHRASGWFNGLEKGLSRITREELEALAGGCGVTVDVLLTGRGLDLSKADVRSNVKASAMNALAVPTFTEAEMQAFFKERFMSPQMKPAEGITAVQILDLMRSQDSADWVTAWVTLTEHGVHVQGHIDKEVEKISKVPDQIRVLILSRIAKLLWPETSS